MKFQNRNKEIEHNRDKLIEIMEKFYEELYRNRRNENLILLFSRKRSIEQRIRRHARNN